MAKTIRSLLVGILGSELVAGSVSKDISQGELFVEAQKRGYNGSQQDLLGKADVLVSNGILFSTPKGRNETMYYGRNC
jgi:hypothetical protein